MCVFLKLQNPTQPCETPETHARHSGPPPRLSLPQRGFDQTEPFMGNDWRMHPLLSLQIYLTERVVGEEGEGVHMEVRESERERETCSSVFHLVLAGSCGAAPAESCT